MQAFQKICKERKKQREEREREGERKKERERENSCCLRMHKLVLFRSINLGVMRKSMRFLVLNTMSRV